MSNRLNNNVVGAVVGRLDPIELEDLLLNAPKIKKDLKQKLLLWYKVSIQDESDFLVLLSEPKVKEEKK